MMFVSVLLFVACLQSVSFHVTGAEPANCRDPDDAIGKDYLGRIYTTVSGKVCQRWDQRTPHTHTLTASQFPDVSLQAAENHCRNPTSHSGGLWCFTQDPGKIWEVCDIPVCEIEAPNRNPAVCFPNPCKDGAECTPDANGGHQCNPDGRFCRTSIGSDYKAHTFWAEEASESCEPWTKNSQIDDGALVDGSKVKAGHMCRNPDGDYRGPWCTEDILLYYTAAVDGKQICPLVEFCVPSPCYPNPCPDGGECTPDANRGHQCKQVFKDCRDDAIGSDYFGKRRTSKSGYTCVAWSDYYTSRTSFRLANFPDESVKETENFCRNPDGKDGGPWCFTMMGSVFWEYCDIPFCVSGENMALHKTAYQSSTSLFRFALEDYTTTADNAVDGNEANDLYEGSCTRTDKEQNPWWAVDLEYEMPVVKVAITARRDIITGEQLDDVIVGVGNTFPDVDVSNYPECGRVTGSFSPEIKRSFYCSNTITGRYVAVYLRKPSAVLTLCEVQVFAK